MQQIPVMEGQHILYHAQYIDWRVREILKPVGAPVHCSIIVPDHYCMHKLTSLTGHV